MSAFRERIPKWAVLFSLSILFSATNVFAQAAPETPKEKPAAVPQEKPAEPPNAAQIELLETKYRFEANGDSRKEVHALVKINSELGVRQFARLNFDYNRSFQSVEIPLVHITHASGGTADILPSAITDNPNPAVLDFPAYQDVRVKSVRILGLQPGDSLEYGVITTTTNHPLAPDFWVEHSFDRTGVVTQELFELNLPRERFAFVPPNLANESPLYGADMKMFSQLDGRIRISPLTPPNSSETMDEGKSVRLLLKWRVLPSKLAVLSSSDSASPPNEPEVVVTTFRSWESLGARLSGFLMRSGGLDVIEPKERELVSTARTGDDLAKVIYEYVSQKIKTVDLPLGATGFATRKPEEILASRYGTPEDKFALFSALARFRYLHFNPLFTFVTAFPEKQLPRPPGLAHLLARAAGAKGRDTVENYFDLSLEVAPYGAIRPDLRGKPALNIYQVLEGSENWWSRTPTELPSLAKQNVEIDASLTPAGTLSAHVTYRLRGDNELLLRIAFHQSPKEKWQEIAQYLALSDGFRGKVTSVKTSDPYATDKPFEVEYELTQEKFVDWLKKPVRIPALLPLPGLPEAPKKPSGDSKIELGPPLDVELRGTLRLPPGMTAQAPPGTSVKRDYASFTAEYSAKQNVVHFSRHLNFVSREISGARFVDFGAFLHAVQNDQAQLFVLEKSEPPASAKPK